MAEAVETTIGSDGEPDLEKQWLELDPGVKARAMRQIHEDQQKLVVDMGRLIMEKQTEIAVALAKAKAESDRNREDRKLEVIRNELQPRRAELEDLRKRAGEERDLLDTFERMGKGIL